MRTERWAFTQSELEHPCELTSLDELVASVKFHCEETGNTLDAVIVYRNGTVSNRWADGTAGIPELIAELAGEDESPYNPDTDEPADTWRDVEVDDEGRFVRFLPETVEI